MGQIDELAVALHETAVEKGFWDDGVDVNFILAKLALVASEVSEVLEAVRKEQGHEKIMEEFADILIRTFDLVEGMKDHGWLSGSLEEAVLSKASVNKERQRRHGNLI